MSGTQVKPAHVTLGVTATTQHQREHISYEAFVANATMENLRFMQIPSYEDHNLTDKEREIQLLICSLDPGCKRETCTILVR